jgi:sirohydrochlorin ferrochelatase
MVLPYFLAEGRHVAQDIPLALAAARRKWPNKHLSLLPHIGAMEAMTKLIAQRCIEELINRHPIQAVTDTYQYYEMGTSA